jgi:hypothetical protein
MNNHCVLHITVIENVDSKHLFLRPSLQNEIVFSTVVDKGEMGSIRNSVPLVNLPIQHLDAMKSAVFYPTTLHGAVHKIEFEQCILVMVQYLI